MTARDTRSDMVLDGGVVRHDDPRVGELTCLRVWGLLFQYAELASREGPPGEAHEPTAEPSSVPVKA